MVWQNRVQHLHAAGRNQPQPNGVPPYNQPSQRHFISIPAHSLSMTGIQPFPENFLAVSQSGSQPFACKDASDDSSGGSITRPTEGVLRVWVLWVE